MRARRTICTYILIILLSLVTVSESTISSCASQSGWSKLVSVLECRLIFCSDLTRAFHISTIENPVSEAQPIPRTKHELHNIWSQTGMIWPSGARWMAPRTLHLMMPSRHITSPSVISSPHYHKLLRWRERIPLALMSPFKIYWKTSSGRKCQTLSYLKPAFH